MKHLKKLLVALPVLLQAPVAGAQDLPWSFGATLTSNYVVYGISQTSGGAAFQPWIQYSKGPFYAGVWMSNVSLAPDSIETDLYLGFAGDLPGSSGLGYDLAYYRYYYNSTGDAGGELIAKLSWAPSDSSSIVITGKNGLAGGPTTGIFGFGYDFANGYGLSGEIGSVFTAGGAQFWNFGVSIPLNDAVGLDIRAHDSSTTTPVATVAISWSGDFSGLFK